MLRLLRPQIAFLTHVEATNSLAWKGSQKELEFEQLAFFDSQVRHFSPILPAAALPALGLAHD